MEEKKITKVTLTADLVFYRNGCWKETIPAGEAELDAEALGHAKALDLIKKGKEK